MDPLVYDLFHHHKPGNKEILKHRGTLMRITVSGLPGSGTTSLSRYLSEHHGFTMISAGEVFRQLAKEHATWDWQSSVAWHRRTRHLIK